MLRQAQTSFPPIDRQRGFSLIEMMVAITVGLIVAAAAVALIVSIDQANSETIQSARLTGELRALATVVTDDIMRARRVNDPIAMVGQGTTKACPSSPKAPSDQPCYSMRTGDTAASAPDTDTSAPKCLAYGYSGLQANRNATTYDTKARTFVYHKVYFNSLSSSAGGLVLAQYTYDPNSVASGTALPTIDPGPTYTNDCSVTGATANPTRPQQLNSDQVNITSVCFSTGAGLNPAGATSGTCYFDTSTSPGKCTLNTTFTPKSNEIDLCIAGKLTSGGYYNKDVTQAFVQSIQVPSGPAN